jgi:hypothetical protein
MGPFGILGKNFGVFFGSIRGAQIWLFLAMPL